MILKVKKQKDYELVDSGEGKKLERYGSYLLVRPDPEALWKKNLESDVWDKAELKFLRNEMSITGLLCNHQPRLRITYY